MIEERRFADVRASDDGHEWRWLLFAQNVSYPDSMKVLLRTENRELLAIIETQCPPHPIPCLPLRDSRSTSFSRPAACSRKRTPPMSFAAGSC
ncbi:hypothetical protein SBA7_200002 [Candidatus Sulfotelmatobacter sp. SbA7]|nr:hypothetical protein SBA7_200002 [Candidatus Sulfotelmatobacter sp. SbA7]